jgi:hypothetical protein
MIKRALLLLVVLATLPVRAAVVLVGDELVVKDGRPNNEHSPVLGFAADNHGLVVWTDSNDGLRGRLVASSGSLATGDLLLVGNDRLPRLPGEGTEIHRKDPALLMRGDGTFWLFWTEETQHVDIDFFHERRDVLDRDVYGQRFDPSGQPAGPPRRLNTAPGGFQSRPRAQALACAQLPCDAPPFVVAWESDDGSPGSAAGEGIVGQLFGGEGDALSPQARLSPPSLAQNVELGPGPQGGLVVAWEAPDDAKPRTILRARFFNAALQPLGKSFALSPTTPGSQRRVNLEWSEANGEATAIFDRTMTATGRYRIMAQRLAAPTRVVGEPFSVSGGMAEAPSASVLTPASSVLALWVSWRGSYPFALQGKELGGKIAGPGAELEVAQWPRNDLAVEAAPSGRMLAVWEGWVSGLRQGIVARWLEQVP